MRELWESVNKRHDSIFVLAKDSGASLNEPAVVL